MTLTFADRLRVLTDLGRKNQREREISDIRYRLEDAAQQGLNSVTMNTVISANDLMKEFPGVTFEYTIHWGCVRASW